MPKHNRFPSSAKSFFREARLSRAGYAFNGRAKHGGFDKSVVLVGNNIHYSVGHVAITLGRKAITIRLVVDDDDIVQPSVGTKYHCKTYQEALAALQTIERDGWIVAKCIVSLVQRYCGADK